MVFDFEATAFLDPQKCSISGVLNFAILKQICIGRYNIFVEKKKKYFFNHID